jgi:hypothetical protein
LATAAVNGEETQEGFHRYHQQLYSAKVNQLAVKVLPFHQKRHDSGRTILRKELEKYKDDGDLIILFTETYDDVIFNSDKNTILDTFFNYFQDARVVFSADKICWPDSNLASKYLYFIIHFTSLKLNYYLIKKVFKRPRRTRSQK